MPVYPFSLHAAPLSSRLAAIRTRLIMIKKSKKWRNPSQMMRARTASADIATAAKWKRFTTEHREALSLIGFPLFLTEKREHFDHWLMHGLHPQDASRFCSDDLPAGARSALLPLLRAYFAAEFKDPGIAILRNEEWAVVQPPSGGQTARRLGRCSNRR